MFAEDLTVFFNDAEFAHAGTHTPPGVGAPAVPCTVLLDEPEEVFAEFSKSRDRTITFSPSLVAGVKRDSVFTLTGKGTFACLHEPTDYDDGALARVTVKKL